MYEARKATNERITYPGVIGVVSDQHGKDVLPLQIPAYQSISGRDGEMAEKETGKIK